MGDIESWTRLSYQYGPFFLALLFCIVITRWGYKIYRRANLRTDPPASDREKSTYRYYFIATASFGILLVIVSVVWWIFHQPSVHVFRGEIKELADYEIIASDEFYFKPMEVKFPGEEVLRIRNEHFVFIQDKPITEDQEFRIYYRKRNGPVEDFSIKYVPGLIAKYKIDWDSLAEKNVIKSLAPPPGNASISLFNTAYAQSEPPVIEKEFPRQKMSMEYTKFDRSIENLIRLLQDERTDVGRKIEVLDMANGFDDEQFREFIETSTPREPIILTLLDLTRHTDRELAFKSRRILNRMDLHAELTRRLLSDDPGMRETVTSILFRMEIPRAEEILDRILEQHQIQWVVDLKKEITSGDRSRVLIPTGSEEGDRYYVKASWNPDNQETVGCLTRLFNTELITDRTLEKEMAIMSARDNRLVYWYSKQWALRMASEIEKCGGSAAFVGF